jgi:hypothetical protein
MITRHFDRSSLQTDHVYKRLYNGDSVDRLEVRQPKSHPKRSNGPYKDFETTGSRAAVGAQTLDESSCLIKTGTTPKAAITMAHIPRVESSRCISSTILQSTRREATTTVLRLRGVHLGGSLYEIFPTLATPFCLTKRTMVVVHYDSEMPEIRVGNRLVYRKDYSGSLALTFNKL